MATKVCIFTGAGISAPLGLPITSGFADTINKIEPSLMAQISSFLKGNDKNDIEKVLYVLEDFVREKSLTDHIVKQGSNDGSSFNVVHNNIETYRHWAKAAIANIKTDIYDILAEFDREKAAYLYVNIIGELQNHYNKNVAISFFTTNYDLTFEDGFADNDDNLKGLGIDDVYYGFGMAKNGKQIYNLNEVYEWQSNIIEYKKLHGSLDWNNDGRGCVKTGSAINPKRPENMPMLYPGFKGVPSTQPFIDIHEKLDQRLNDADVVIVIGFAFRDEYINSVFDYAIKRNSNLEIFCYNPCELEDLPADSRLSYFVNKWDRFRHVKKRIELEPNPLNFASVNF